MKYLKTDNSTHSFFFCMKERLSKPLMVSLISLILSTPASALIAYQSVITSAKDIEFAVSRKSSSSQENASDFSIALQSRILNLLTQQLLESRNKEFKSSFIESSIFYKTNTFIVNIVSNVDNRIRIEIHDHGMSLPKIVEVSTK